MVSRDDLAAVEADNCDMCNPDWFAVTVVVSIPPDTVNSVRDFKTELPESELIGTAAFSAFPLSLYCPLSQKGSEIFMTDRDIPVSDEVRRTVAQQILSGIETLIDEAQTALKPLEVDPWRSRLFEFFVTADGANLVGDERASSVNDDTVEDETDLSADGLCRSLARRWGLDMAARDSAAQQTKLPADQLERMRLLWSLMRMWMEWNYAWCRWEEFHAAAESSSS